LREGGQRRRKRRAAWESSREDRWVGDKERGREEGSKTRGKRVVGGKKGEKERRKVRREGVDEERQ